MGRDRAPCFACFSRLRSRWTRRYGVDSMSSKRVVVSLAPVLALVLASPASAVNRYIDDSGTDAGMCQSAAAPCKTINYALGVGSSTDTYLVGGGSYPENVIIGGSAALIGSNFKPPATAGAAIVDGGGGTGITSSASGQIRGLTVRGDTHAILVNDGSPTISHDVFDDPHANVFGRVDVKSPAQANVAASTFLGVSGTNNDGLGVYSETSGPVTVAGSTFRHVTDGIWTTQANSITVRDNTILFHSVNAPTEGTAVALLDGSGSIVGNRITAEPPGATQAISLNGGDVSLHANQIRGSTANVAVSILNPAHLVALDSDVIVGAGRQGISASGASVGLKLTNETITANTGPGQVVTDGPLSIDSSIIGAGGRSAAGGCAITFSRGPTTTGNSWQRFQASPNPQFLSPMNFHLLPSSPLIAAGNPMEPP